MAGSIDKASVRKQLNAIKEDFKTLSTSGKVPDETALLFKSLFTLLEVVLAIFMEKTTKKTSKNSGIPPSQSDPATSRGGAATQS